MRGRGVKFSESQSISVRVSTFDGLAVTWAIPSAGDPAIDQSATLWGRRHVEQRCQPRGAGQPPPEVTERVKPAEDAALRRDHMHLPQARFARQRRGEAR